MAKVQISIDDGLLNRLEAYASKNYLSRSGIITLACTQFLNTYETTQAIRDISVSLRRIADTGVVDDETMKEIRQFEIFSKMLASGSAGSV